MKPLHARLLVGTAGAFVVYASGSLALLYFFRQEAFDLGIYDQSLWLLWTGGRFNTVGGAHVFGAHFSPILFLLAPLSALPGGASPELIVQSALIASGLFPAYHLARKFDRSPTVAATVYALHPGIVSGAWYGFRPWNLAAPFLMWSIYWLFLRPTSWTLLILGTLGLLVREDIAVWVALGALILVLAKRMTGRAWAVATAILAIETLVVVGLVLPQWAPSGTYIYEDTVVGADVTEPIAIWVASVLARVALLVLPLGIGTKELRRMPAMLLLVIPIVGLVVRGGNALLPGLHYDMLFVPLLILIVARWAPTEPRLSHVLTGVVLVSFALTPLRPFGPKPTSNPFTISASQGSEFSELRDTVLDLAGPESSIMVPSRMVAHLSGRNRIFLFPYPFDAPSHEPLAMSCPNPDLVVVPKSYEVAAPQWEALVERYDRVADTENYWVGTSTATSTGPCGPA